MFDINVAKKGRWFVVCLFTYVHKIKTITDKAEVKIVVRGSTAIDEVAYSGIIVTSCPTCTAEYNLNIVT